MSSWQELGIMVRKSREEGNMDVKIKEEIIGCVVER